MKDKYAEFKKTTYETAAFRSFPTQSMEMMAEPKKAKAKKK